MVALRHKIGSIVNDIGNALNEQVRFLSIQRIKNNGKCIGYNEIYANRYAKDSETLMNEARKSARQENWNNYEKARIKEEVKKKLKEELEKKDFLDNKKFEVMEQETEKMLKDLELI